MRIHHIALYCQQLDAMRQFFERYFLVKSGPLYHNPRTGLKTYMLTLGDGEPMIELMTRPQLSAPQMQETATGYHHLSLLLESKEALSAKTLELRNDGWKVLSGPRTTGDGYYESVIEGPENLILELTSGKA